MSPCSSKEITLPLLFALAGISTIASTITLKLPSYCYAIGGSSIALGPLLCLAIHNCQKPLESMTKEKFMGAFLNNQLERDYYIEIITAHNHLWFHYDHAKKKFALLKGQLPSTEVNFIDISAFEKYPSRPLLSLSLEGKEYHPFEHFFISNLSNQTS